MVCFTFQITMNIKKSKMRMGKTLARKQNHIIILLFYQHYMVKIFE